MSYEKAYYLEAELEEELNEDEDIEKGLDEDDDDNYDDENGYDADDDDDESENDEFDSEDSDEDDEEKDEEPRPMTYDDLDEYGDDTTEDEEDEHEFGSDDSDVNNDYDSKDVDTLNKLISSEASAVQEYLDADKVTSNRNLSRLYSDIANEERFHIEQLMYAKSKITGEKYEPADPEVKREYEELCNSGMDEDTALSTACDRCAISNDKYYTDDSIDEIIDDINDFTESFVESVTNNLVLASIESNVQDIYLEYADAMYMEAIQNSSDKTVRTDDSVHPIKFIISSFVGILKFIRKIVVRIKEFLRKVHIKDMNKINWIKRHGIKDLFKDGIWLYLWSDDQNHVAGINDAYRYLDLFDRVMKTIQNSMYRKKEISPSSIRSNIPSINNPLKFKNVEDGVRILRNVIFSKEKVIITESNESDLEKIFFGVSENSGQMSLNFYNFLDQLAGHFERLSNDCEELLKSLHELEGNYDSVYSKNPSLYKKLIFGTKSLSKDFTKFSKVIAHDTTVIMKLNTGLYELMKEYDENKKYNRGQNEEAKEDIQNGNFKPKAAPEGLKDYYPSSNEGGKSVRPSRF